MSTVSEDIVKGFLYKLQNDPQLKTILKGIKENGGDYKDAEKYAGRAGQLLTEVFKANITSGNFPAGSVKDIASLIVPAMELNHTAVTQVTGMVQKALNKDGGFGMNPIKSSFDKSGAYNLVGRMAKYESFEDAAFMLDEPVQTASRAMTDAMLHDNADFQYKSGMRPKIVRTCESDACEWCQMLEGEYDYEEVRDRGDPVYQRHNNCACEITYEPGDGRVQDVRSKQWYDEEKAQERINFAKSNNDKYKRNNYIRIPEYPASSVIKKVKSGRYSLKLSWNSYNKHLEGTSDYKRYQESRARQGLGPQGVLLITKDEAQEIINRQSGTGIIKLNRYGEPLDHEFITCDRVIGKYYDKDGEHLTSKARIDHGNRGSHLIPIKGNDYD